MKLISLALTILAVTGCSFATPALTVTGGSLTLSPNSPTASIPPLVSTTKPASVVLPGDAASVEPLPTATPTPVPTPAQTAKPLSESGLVAVVSESQAQASSSVVLESVSRSPSTQEVLPSSVVAEVTNEEYDYGSGSSFTVSVRVKLVFKDDSDQVLLWSNGDVEIELITENGTSLGMVKGRASDSFKLTTDRLYSEDSGKTVYARIYARLYGRTRNVNLDSGLVPSRLTLRPNPDKIPDSYDSIYDYGSSYGGGGTVYVDGYFRKDGTYVRPHTRRK